jgi:hypothetical protein
MPSSRICFQSATLTVALIIGSLSVNFKFVTALPSLHLPTSLN